MKASTRHNYFAIVFSCELSPLATGTSTSSSAGFASLENCFICARTNENLPCPLKSQLIMFVYSKLSQLLDETTLWTCFALWPFFKMRKMTIMQRLYFLFLGTVPVKIPIGIANPRKRPESLERKGENATPPVGHEVN